MRNYKKNDYQLRGFLILSAVLTYTPISIIFYQYWGLTFSQITIVKTLTFISTVIFEVPSGYLGDRMGYKKIVQLGTVALIVSCMGNAFLSSFNLFCIWGVIWGIGVALLSGTDEAWYYSFLKSQDKEEEYGNKISSVYSSVQFVTAFSLIISAPLYEINVRLPYILNSIIFIVALLMTVSVKNIDSQKKEYKETANRLEIKGEGLLSSIAYIVLFTVIVTAFIIFIFETYQPGMYDVGIPISANGIIYFIFTIISGLGSKFYQVLSKKNLVKFNLFSFTGISLGLATTTLIMALFNLNYIALLIIYFMQEFFYGYFRVFSNAAINLHIGDKYRATIISIISLMTNGFKGVVFLTFGKSMDVIGIRGTYGWITGAIVIFSVIIVIIQLLIARYIIRRG